jgi:hypothetical protein
MPASTIDIDQAATSTAVFVREANFADYDGIAALMQQYGMEVYSREDWEELWKGNPVYAQRAEDWPIGWVLESRHQRVVGFSGNIPVACALGRRDLTAGVTTAWVVDSEFRSHSMLLASKYFSQKKVDLLVNTTAIHTAGQIFRAFHAKPMPGEGLDTALFWVLDYPGFAASFLTRKSVPLARVASYPVGMGLAAMALMKSGFPQNVSVPMETADDFDQRFDAFWQELKQKSAVLMSVRDRTTLRWHFGRSLRANGLWIHTYEKNGRLLAYAIFQRHDKADVGLTRARLVDFQSLDEDPRILESVIIAGLRRAKSEGVQMVEVVGFSGALRKQLERLAPFRRKLPSQLFYYKAMSKELKAQLDNPQAWMPTSYDGDSSL